MPRLQHNDLGAISDWEYRRGRIKKLYRDSDEADVEIDGLQEFRCLLFFHCEHDAQMHGSGAIKGSSKQFRVGDYVVVGLKLVKGSPGTAEQAYVFGLVDKKRKCRIGFRFVGDDGHVFTKTDGIISPVLYKKDPENGPEAWNRAVLCASRAYDMIYYDEESQAWLLSDEAYQILPDEGVWMGATISGVEPGRTPYYPPIRGLNAEEGDTENRACYYHGPQVYVPNLFTWKDAVAGKETVTSMGRFEPGKVFADEDMILAQGSGIPAKESNTDGADPWILVLKIPTLKFDITTQGPWNRKRVAMDGHDPFTGEWVVFPATHYYNVQFSFSRGATSLKWSAWTELFFRFGLFTWNTDGKTRAKSQGGPAAGTSFLGNYAPPMYSYGECRNGVESKANVAWSDAVYFPNKAFELDGERYTFAEFPGNGEAQAGEFNTSHTIMRTIDAWPKGWQGYGSAYATSRSLGCPHTYSWFAQVICWCISYLDVLVEFAGDIYQPYIEIELGYHGDD